MQEIKPLVQLWNYIGLGLIILRPSGVFYSNQTGGHYCLQSKGEGIFVPVHDECKEQEKNLLQYFTTERQEKIKERPMKYSLYNEDADFIDSVLDLSVATKVLRVDRERLDDSHEAWVYVTVADQPLEPLALGDFITGETASGRVWRGADYEHLPIAGDLYTFFGFGECRGVLTWCNSD